MKLDSRPFRRVYSSKTDFGQRKRRMDGDIDRRYGKDSGDSS